MLTYHDIRTSFRKLQIDPHKPLIFHASLSSFGEIRGGVDTVMGILLLTSDALLAPAFTYKTMVIPEDGPQNNGITYGSGRDLNRMAQFFEKDMPADPTISYLSEALRLHPRSDGRSMHPILSFTGFNARQGLDRQSLLNPLGPIEWLYEENGNVLLMGVDHTANTGIHLAEKLAGRKQFVRWALTPQGVVECKGFPGCSDGFNEAETVLRDMTHEVRLGEMRIRVLPIRSMLAEIIDILELNPLALLCNREDCERCNEIRRTISQPDPEAVEIEE